MFPNSVAMKTLNPNEVRYCCPNCADDKFHLYYNLKKNVFHCVKCGHKGRSAPEKTYTEEALTEMFEILYGEREVDEAEHSLILPPCHPVVSGSFAMRYMLRRGIPIEKVSAMGCMVSNDPKFENRIIIPVFDPGGKIVFYQARALLKSMRPKYLNPIKPKNESLFYSLSYILPSELDHLYVTEGIFKALKFWAIREPAVAIFGKEVTVGQLRRICKCTDDVTIMLDPDAFNFAIRMGDQMEVMKQWSRIRVIQPPKAPDDMTDQELKTLLREELHNGY